MIQLALAKMEAYISDYGYKVYTTTMLKIIAQPHCKNPLPSWTHMMDNKMRVNANQSVKEITEGMIERCGLEIIDEEVE